MKAPFRSKLDAKPESEIRNQLFQATINSELIKQDLSKLLTSYKDFRRSNSNMSRMKYQKNNFRKKVDFPITSFDPLFDFKVAEKRRFHRNRLKHDLAHKIPNAKFPGKKSTSLLSLGTNEFGETSRNFNSSHRKVCQDTYSDAFDLDSLKKSVNIIDIDKHTDHMKFSNISCLSKDKSLDKIIAEHEERKFKRSKCKTEGSTYEKIDPIFNVLTPSRTSFQEMVNLRENTKRRFIPTRENEVSIDTSNESLHRKNPDSNFQNKWRERSSKIDHVKNAMKGQDHSLKDRGQLTPGGNIMKKQDKNDLFKMSLQDNEQDNYDENLSSEKPKEIFEFIDSKTLSVDRERYKPQSRLTDEESYSFARTAESDKTHQETPRKTLKNGKYQTNRKSSQREINVEESLSEDHNSKSNVTFSTEKTFTSRKGSLRYFPERDEGDTDRYPVKDEHKSSNNPTRENVSLFSKETYSQVQLEDLGINELASKDSKISIDNNIQVNPNDNSRSGLTQSLHFDKGGGEKSHRFNSNKCNHTYHVTAQKNREEIHGNKISYYDQPANFAASQGQQPHPCQMYASAFGNNYESTQLMQNTDSNMHQHSKIFGQFNPALDQTSYRQHTGMNWAPNLQFVTQQIDGNGFQTTIPEFDFNQVHPQISPNIILTPIFRGVSVDQANNPPMEVPVVHSGCSDENSYMKPNCAMPINTNIYGVRPSRSESSGHFLRGQAPMRLASAHCSNSVIGCPFSVGKMCLPCCHGSPCQNESSSRYDHLNHQGNFKCPFSFYRHQVAITQGTCPNFPSQQCPQCHNAMSQERFSPLNFPHNYYGAYPQSYDGSCCPMGYGSCFPMGYGSHYSCASQIMHQMPYDNSVSEKVRVQYERNSSINAPISRFHIRKRRQKARIESIKSCSRSIPQPSDVFYR